MARGAKHISHDQFMIKFNRKVGSDYTVLTKYISSKEYITVRHNVCGHEYPVTPSKILFGRRCPKCYGTPKKTKEEFQSELNANRKGEVIIVGDYRGLNSETEFYHKTCDEYFLSLPILVLKSKSCPNCCPNKRKTKEAFLAEITDVHLGKISLIGEYYNTTTETEFLCLACNKEFQNIPERISRGNGCPNCRLSKGEREIARFLTENHVEYIPQFPIKYQRNKRPLKLDFYTCGIAIEYDGEYHYHPMPHAKGEEGLRAQQERDLIKDKYCADNGIPLIRIPYWEYDNIDAILTEKLLPLLAEKNAC